MNQLELIDMYIKYHPKPQNTYLFQCTPNKYQNRQYCGAIASLSLNEIKEKKISSKSITIKSTLI